MGLVWSKLDNRNAPGHGAVKQKQLKNLLVTIVIWQNSGEAHSEACLMVQNYEEARAFVPHRHRLLCTGNTQIQGFCRSRSAEQLQSTLSVCLLRWNFFCVRTHVSKMICHLLLSVLELTTYCLQLLCMT